MLIGKRSDCGNDTMDHGPKNSKALGLDAALEKFINSTNGDCANAEANSKTTVKTQNKELNIKFDNKKKFLIFCVIIIIFMGIFPPWKYTFHGGGFISEKSAGYFLITNPPEPEHTHASRGVKIDTTRLFIQCGIVFLVFGTGHLLIHWNGKN